MADNVFADIFESDSEDENFAGFDPADIGEYELEEINVDDVNLDENELLEIDRELEAEERDPFFEAYDSEWLRNFVTETGPVGFDEDSTPYDIFSRFFDDEVIDVLVTETNRYYEQFINSKGGKENLTKACRARSWNDVTNDEIRAFLAILLYMGLVKLPNYNMYWSTHDLLNLKNFTSLMTRDRFLNILSYLHATDNDLEPPRDSPTYDPGYKLAKIVRLIVQRWQANYKPHREISIDETLVPFKGRTKLLQYIPSKPHKWGLKVWTLADAQTGYVYNWSLYTGKMPPDVRGRGVAHRVVTSLCQPLYGLGHHLYVDNFFTSPALFEELAVNQTGACGTLRVNRIGVPAEVKHAKPPKGDPPVVHRDGRNLYINWCDKRLVHLMTSVHNGSTFLKRVRSKFHDNHVREVHHPRAVQLYTQYMGGVDLADQQISYCALLHRMVKWWKKLFICNILEVCVGNSKAIYKELNPQKRLTTDKFRLQIITGLLEGWERRNKRFSRPATNPTSRLLERHFPKLNPSMTAKGRRSNPDCEVCSNRSEKRRHQTQYMCCVCDVPLCVHPCFSRYHTLVQYKVTCSPELHQ